MRSKKIKGLITVLMLLLIIIISSFAAIDDLKKQSLSELYKAQKSLEELAKIGISSVRASDIVKEGEIAIEKSDYERAISLCNEAIALSETIIRTNNELNSTKSSIDKARKFEFSLSKAEDSISSAENLFRNEDYEGTEDYLKKANEELKSIASLQFSDLLSGLHEIEIKTNENIIQARIVNSTRIKVKSAIEEVNFLALQLLSEEVENMGNAVDSLSSIQANIKSMPPNQKNERIKDILEEAEAAFSIGDFKRTISLAEGSKNLKEGALFYQVR